MFVCNPVTSKINHDFITFTGSTPKANEKPDFLTSDDLWFHPVDLQLGPDSALYIADFYNRIIGHYEVPLDHPGRDRKSGRIWRVLKKGCTGKLAECDLGKAKPGELVEALGSKNITQRGLALESLLARPEIDFRGREFFRPEYESFLKFVAPEDLVCGKGENSLQQATWYWFATRGNISVPIEFSFRQPNALSRIHSAKSLAEQALFVKGIVVQCSLDVDPRVAAGGLEMSGLVKEPLLTPAQMIDLRDKIKPDDSRLKHCWLLAMREMLLRLDDWHLMPPVAFRKDVEEDLIKVACAISKPEAADWLISRVSRQNGTYLKSLASVDAMLIHIARYLPAERQGELVDLVQKHFGEDIDTQLDLFNAIAAGSATLRSRLSNETKERALSEATTESRAPSKSLRAWAEVLAQRLTDALDAKTDSDWSQLASTNPQSASPWFRQMRKCEDGTERPFLCSLPPGGEKLTGTIQSKVFDLPNTFFFWIAGHRGLPGGPAHEKNFVQLVDEATGAVVAKAFPPCHDTAVSVTWELSETESKRGHLELVDGDSGTAYAWLAVGGFSPQVVDVPDLNGLPNDKRIRAAAELARIWETHEDASATIKKYSSPAFPDLAKRLNALPHREAYAADTRVALARLCMMSLFMPQEVPELARDPDLAATVFKVLEDNNEHSNLAAAFKTLPSRPQIKLASALATSLDSAKLLLKFAAPTVLADPLVSGKLNALDDPEITKQLKAATASLPPQNEALNKLIAQRLKSFDPAKANPSRGQDSFMRNCSVCHRIGVKGNLVGPQLDGVGARGAERLIEDIMDPNRAVDPAFRLHILRLKSGGLMTGLLRRGQDDELVFADTAGQEHSVKKADVAEEQVSPFSLMPSGFGEILPEQELHDLMAFLLERKS
jgi:putative heme-binding domain-containing protein